MRSKEKLTVVLTRAQARMLSGAAQLRIEQLPDGPDRRALENAAHHLDEARRHAPVEPSRG